MKIKLISHGPRDPGASMVFTDILTFKIHTDDGLIEDAMRQDAEQKLQSVCAWCSATFQHNFILIEHVGARIAGGFTDNHRGWVVSGGQVNRQDYAWQSTYELRCMAQDATWFKINLT